MAATNSTEGGTQMKTFEELVCSSSSEGKLRQYSLRLSAVIIFFSLTAFLGNALIVVALHKVASLHPPSKLLYRCLATSDLLVGLIGQPLTATLWMSVVFEQWRLSIRMGSSLHFRLWIIFYIFVDTGSHERGQTSRPVVGAEI